MNEHQKIHLGVLSGAESGRDCTEEWTENSEFSALQSKLPKEECSSQNKKYSEQI